MLNKNGKQFYRPLTRKTSENGKLKTIEGTNYNAPPSNNDFRFYEVRVGSGTTEPTMDDVDLEAYVSSLTKISNTEKYPSDYDANYIASYTTSFKNNTDVDVTISEIGVFYAYQYSGVSNICMVAREVISPVTIAPQKTYTFSMTIG